LRTWLSSSRLHKDGAQGFVFRPQRPTRSSAIV
jgi:hypothetical protein